MEWSTRAPRGRHDRMVSDVPRISTRTVGTHHKDRKNKEVEKKHMGATSTDKTSNEPTGADLSRHQPLAQSGTLANMVH